MTHIIYQLLSTCMFPPLKRAQSYHTAVVGSFSIHTNALLPTSARLLLSRSLGCGARRTHHTHARLPTLYPQRATSQQPTCLVSVVWSGLVVPKRNKQMRRNYCMTDDRPRIKKKVAPFSSSACSVQRHFTTAGVDWAVAITSRANPCATCYGVYCCSRLCLGRGEEEIPGRGVTHSYPGSRHSPRGCGGEETQQQQQCLCVSCCLRQSSPTTPLLTTTVLASYQ